MYPQYYGLESAIMLSEETVQGLRRDRDALQRRKAEIEKRLQLIDQLLASRGEGEEVVSEALRPPGHQSVRGNGQRSIAQQASPPNPPASPYAGLRKAIRTILRESEGGLTCKEVVAQLRAAGYPDRAPGVSTALNNRVHNELYVMVRDGKGERDEEKRYRIIDR